MYLQHTHPTFNLGTLMCHVVDQLAAELEIRPLHDQATTEIQAEVDTPDLYDTLCQMLDR